MIERTSSCTFLTSEYITYLFRILTLSQAILLVFFFLIHERHRAGFLIGLAGFAYGCYLVMPLLPQPLPHWAMIPAIFATAIPSIVWLLVHWFFRDERNVPLWLIAVTVIYVTLTFFPDGQLRSALPNPDLRTLILDLSPQLLKLALVIHLIYMALSEREADLVNLRRTLRRPLALGIGTLAALVIVVEIWSRGSTPPLVEASGSVLMFLLTMTALLCIFDSRLSLRPTVQPVRHRQEDRPELLDENREVTQLLEKAMTTGRLYAEHGLTLADLAEHLHTPVHRLRNIINRQLGYRNFNQFLNRYRIQEASERLRAEASLPILTIALDVGFRSLSSFNAAFRATHDMTPTQFRTEATEIRRD